jgi:hypothetical protein
MVEESQRLGKILCNTAPIRDAVIAETGPQEFHDAIWSNWNEWLQERESHIPDLELVWGNGVLGESGIERGWDRVTTGSIAPHEALVFRLG